MKPRTKEEFVEIANKVHEEKYSYINSIYVNSKSKILINCIKHGEFEQIASNHLRKHGCPGCATDKKRELFISNAKEFIEKANKKHNNRYIYNDIKYFGNAVKVNVICPSHGNWDITPANHLFGYGCPGCGGSKQLTTESFIEKANIAHSNKYIYNLSSYTNNKSKLTIICPINNHGSFNQLASSHLRGAGCPKCGSNNISNAETQWLDYLNIPKENRHITLKINNIRYIVDAYVPETNTIYEFNGDYWHGNLKTYKAEDINKRNKKTFGELNSATIKKENTILSAGYKLVSIWESEWKKIIIVK